MIPNQEKTATSYIHMFFGLVENVDDVTGEFTFKLPKETIEKLKKHCRLELGKTKDGNDQEEPQPPKLSLAEKIRRAEADVNYYQDQLKPAKWERWMLNDLVFFEYRLRECKEALKKLRKRKRWLENSHRQEKSVDVEALKQANDLVEVAESYGLKLRKRGKEFWALCPFHQEKTPSFSINQEKQQYYCFGCGAKGDLIAFIMKMENCDFLQAVEVLR